MPVSFLGPIGTMVELELLEARFEEFELTELIFVDVELIACELETGCEVMDEEIAELEMELAERTACKRLKKAGENVDLFTTPQSSFSSSTTSTLHEPLSTNSNEVVNKT